MSAKNGGCGVVKKLHFGERSDLPEEEKGIVR